MLDEQWNWPLDQTDFSTSWGNGGSFNSAIVLTLITNRALSFAVEYGQSSTHIDRNNACERCTVEKTTDCIYEYGC